MTKRTMHADSNATIRISAGVNVRVMGWERDTIQAETDNRWRGMVVKDMPDAIEVSFGGSGEVRVPSGARIVTSAGRDVHISDMHTVVEASAGHDLSLDCQVIEHNDITFSSGHDLRIGIRELPSATIDVHDIGGKWQGRIGEGHTQLHLRAGGVATLVTDDEVVALPPHNVLGNIERFNSSPVPVS